MRRPARLLARAARTCWRDARIPTVLLAVHTAVVLVSLPTCPVWTTVIFLWGVGGMACHVAVGVLVARRNRRLERAERRQQQQEAVRQMAHWN